MPFHDRWLVLAPAVVAAALAIWSLGYGLPFLFRPDEDLLVGRVVRMAAQGSLDPLLYFYPPLAYLLTAAVESGLGHAGLVALGSAAQVDPTGAYLAARGVSAAAQVGAVVAVFFAGRRAHGPAAGLLGAFVLAVAPLAVRQAHFATTDALQAACGAGCLWAAISAERWKGFALAGLLAGLAAAAKYPGGLVVAAPLVLAWGRPDRPRLLAAAAVGALAGLLLPIAPAGHWSDYAHGLLLQFTRASGGGSGERGIVFYPTVALPFGLGLGAFALVLAGVAAAVRERRPADLALLAVVLAFLVVYGPSQQIFFRYMVPLLPALAILAGGSLRLLPSRALAPAGIAAALLLAPSLYASIQTDRLLAQPDTRVLAAAWLLKNLPPGTTVGQSNYFGELFYGPEDLRGNRLHAVYIAGDSVADSYQLGLYTTRLRPVPGIGAVTVLESAQPYQGPPPRAGGRQTLAVFSAGSSSGGVYDPSDAFFLPIWGFGGIERPGPAIRIVAG